MSRLTTHVDVRLDGVAHGGWCVGRHEGQVVFVRHALPGERVRARITEETRRFLRAEAVEVLEASPDRVAPPCPFAGPGRCGGCDWQHASLDAQRRLKAQVVAEQLRRIAGIDREVAVEELPGTPDGLGWRTRVRFAVTPDGTVGLRRHRSHSIEPVDYCPLAHPGIDRLNVPRKTWRNAAEIEVAAAAGTGDTLVTVTPARTGTPELPALDSPVTVLRRSRNGRVQPPRGRHGVTENAAGRRWWVSAGAFWQIHPAAAETLTGAVLDALDPQPGQTALDLYCGVGLFAGALGAAVGPQGRVFGVESGAEAVRDARHNLRDLPQVQITRADVATHLRRWTPPRIDLVVADPSRSGMGADVVRRLAALRPQRIAYVSCDPATFARDLAVFAEHGYRMDGLRAFDAFPMTHHVECVGVLLPA